MSSKNMFETRDWNSICSRVNQSLIKIENVIEDEPATERLFTEEWWSTQPKFYSAWDESTKPIEYTNQTERSNE